MYAKLNSACTVCATCCCWIHSTVRRQDRAYWCILFESFHKSRESLFEIFFRDDSFVVTWNAAQAGETMYCADIYILYISAGTWWGEIKQLGDIYMFALKANLREDLSALIENCRKMRARKLHSWRVSFFGAAGAPCNQLKAIRAAQSAIMKRARSIARNGNEHPRVIT